MAARGKPANGEGSATERTEQRAVELMRGGMSGKAAFEGIAEETGESAGPVRAARPRSGPSPRVGGGCKGGERPPRAETPPRPGRLRTRAVAAAVAAQPQ